MGNHVFFLSFPSEANRHVWLLGVLFRRARSVGNAWKQRGRRELRRYERVGFLIYACLKSPTLNLKKV